MRPTDFKSDMSTNSITPATLSGYRGAGRNTGHTGQTDHAGHTGHTGQTDHAAQTHLAASRREWLRALRVCRCCGGGHAAVSPMQEAVASGHDPGAFRLTRTD